MRDEERSLLRLPELNYPWIGEEPKVIRLQNRGTRTFTNSVVNYYLDILEVARRRANDQSLSRRERSATSSAWALLRDCAIFEIPVRLYLTFYASAESFVGRRALRTEKFAPLTHSDEVHRYTESLKRLAAGIELPAQMPFPYCYLGYSSPLVIPEGLLEAYIREGALPPATSILALAGHVVAADRVSAVIVAEMPAEGGFNSLIELQPQWDKLGSLPWHPITLQPWIIPALIEWINEHKTVIEERRGVGYKLKVKRLAKKLKEPKLVPPPYYTVRMQDVLITEREMEQGAESQREIDWQHRWTVRGHWMIRVRRGPLPLDPRLEANLRKRKYKIFTCDHPDGETWRHLRHRGVEPKRVDEWLAVLISWRKDYVKGPGDKPLIPSVRKSGRSGKRGGSDAQVQPGESILGHQSERSDSAG